MSAEYDSIISKWSSIFNVPFALIKSIIRVESNFNPDARNPSSSATGLMQLISGTWNWMTGGSGDPTKPNDNIAAGAKYLSLNLKRTGGDLEHTVANYYAGTAYKDSSGRWYRYSKDSAGNQFKNYDVDAYVTKVMGWYAKYSGSSGGSGSSNSPSPQGTIMFGSGASSDASGTDIGLLILGGVVGLLFLRKVVKKREA